MKCLLHVKLGLENDFLTKPKVGDNGNLKRLKRYLMMHRYQQVVEPQQDVEK